MAVRILLRHRAPEEQDSSTTGWDYAQPATCQVRGMLMFNPLAQTSLGSNNLWSIGSTCYILSLPGLPISLW